MNPRSNRTRLIEDHLDHVRRTAQRVRQGQVAVEDLISVGNLALVEAADRWDPDYGIEFWPWAYTHVKGAMIEEVRRWTHWRVRSRLRITPDENINDSSSDACFTIGREIDDCHYLIESMKAISSSRHVSIFLRWALLGYSMVEIGRQEGVSESRVCQICTLTAARLRYIMHE